MDDGKELRDFKVLKYIDKFKTYFEKSGIDYPIMRRLLQLMLIMDGRRSITVLGNRSGKKRDNENIFGSYIMSYGILGIFIMIMMLVPFSLFYKMSIVHGMIIFMVMTTMVSDFSSVMLDTKDKIILVPRPIDAKTINTAKTLHIIIYIALITFTIAGPSLVAGTIRYGVVFFIIFLIQLVFVAVFVIFLTSILYFLVLQFFDGEKLKDVINYFQIILSVAMTIGYQFMGRAFQIFSVDVVFTPKWWVYLVPPMWFAAPYSVFIENSSNMAYIVLTVLSLLVPVLLFLIYSNKMSPYFERNLTKLASTGGKKAAVLERRSSLRQKIASIVCPKRQENIFYRFTGSMMSNERQLKLKLYPSLAYSVVFPFIFMISFFTGGRPVSDSLKNIKNGPFYLYMYISIVFLSSLFILIYNSERFKGAWIYRTLPIEDPAPIFKGAMKSFIIRYSLPVFLVLSLLFLLLYGKSFIPHIFIIFLNLLILTVINFKVYGKNLPFSMEFTAQQQNAGCLLYVVSFGYCIVNGAVEFLLSKTRFGLYPYIAVLIAVFLVLWKTSFKFKWEDILKEES